MLARDGVLMFALFAFYGLFMAATEGVEKALVANLAPANERGIAARGVRFRRDVLIACRTLAGNGTRCTSERCRSSC
jgi:hypothetical protein